MGDGSSSSLCEVCHGNLSIETHFYGNMIVVNCFMSDRDGRAHEESETRDNVLTGGRGISGGNCGGQRSKKKMLRPARHVNGSVQRLVVE